MGRAGLNARSDACPRNGGKIPGSRGPVAPLNRQPIALGVFDGGERVSVGLLFAKVSAYHFGVAHLGECPVCSSGVGDPVNPITAVALRQKPASERDLRLMRSQMRPPARTTDIAGVPTFKAV